MQKGNTTGVIMYDYNTPVEVVASRIFNGTVQFHQSMHMDIAINTVNYALERTVPISDEERYWLDVRNQVREMFGENKKWKPDKSKFESNADEEHRNLMNAIGTKTVELGLWDSDWLMEKHSDLVAERMAEKEMQDTWEEIQEQSALPPPAPVVAKDERPPEPIQKQIKFPL